MSDKYPYSIQLLRNYDRHRGILDILKDIEQLLSAPYDPEYLANWIDGTRTYHYRCMEQCAKRALEVIKEMDNDVLDTEQ